MRSPHRIVVVILYVLLIYVATLILSLGGFLEGKGAISNVFIAAYILLAFVLLFQGVKRFGLRNFYAWFYLAALVTLLMMAAFNLPEPKDRLHFLEYGLLFILVYRALRPNVSGFFSYSLALVATFALGLIDEGLQFFYPNSMMDFADVMRNTFAGYLAAGVMLVWERC